VNPYKPATVIEAEWAYVAKGEGMRRNVKISLAQFGVLALIGALASIALGFIFKTHEMAPHVYATGAAILAEAALVIFVLDRLAQAERQREWAFVSRVVGRRMAACMVDVLRLCCVSWSSVAFKANIGRYSEFRGIAGLHFADLRSSLEGLAIGAEPRDYERARTIEFVSHG
jgi:hypothetical protein